MKKTLTKILSLIVTIVIATGIFSGCELITTNAERDMAQIVATVQLDTSMEKENITKRQLVSYYNSTGYLYVYYYGQTVSETYEQLLKELVQNRIIVQQAKLALTEASPYIGTKKGYFKLASEVAESERSNKDKLLLKPNYKNVAMTEIKKTDSVDAFLTGYEVLSAKYEVFSSAVSLIDSMKNEQEDEQDYPSESITVTNRTTLTVPTEAQANEWEIENDSELKKITDSYKKTFSKVNKDNELGLDMNSYKTKYEMSKAVYEAYLSKYDFSNTENRRAITRLIKQLKNNGFITVDEANKALPTTADELLSLTFFKDSLTSAYESRLIKKFEYALENEQEKAIQSDETLYQEYCELYENQKALYENNYSLYESALSDATSSTFVVYNPDFGGNYGYIANLLIGFNAEQDASLKAWKKSEKYPTQNAYRDDLLKQLKVKDLRETWVLSNLGDYSEQNGKFTFKNDYCKTDALKTYGGVITGAKAYTTLDSDGEEVTSYTYKKVTPTEYAFDDFYTNVVSAVMGFEGKEGKLLNVEDETIVSKTIKEEQLVKFRDLIYAYSTDPGSLQENYGYLYSPLTSATSYVSEYATAAKQLIEDGVGSYKVVGTEYGYHIMLCTSVLTPTKDKMASRETFLNDVKKEGTLAYEFKEYKHNLISTSTISTITNTLINKAIDNEDIVVYYEKTYKDLLEE